MNNIPNEKLDLIWAMASNEFVKDILIEAEPSESDIKIDDATDNKILHLIRKNNRRTKRRQVWKALRIALVACLALATLALAACMAMPTVREAIWKVVLEWGEESVKIDFVPNDDPDYTTSGNTSEDPSSTTTTAGSTDEPDEPVVEPPKSIEEVNVPSYMPVGYTTESSLMHNAFRLSYYNENEERVCIFRQVTIDSTTTGDAEGGIAKELTINGLSAIQISYSDEPNVYYLIWQDSKYRYIIYGYFESYDELIRLATSVEVK